MSKQQERAGAAVAVATTFIHELGNALCRATGLPVVGHNQLSLMAQLYIHGEIAQADLEKFTGLEKSANSRNVQKLGRGEDPRKKPGPHLVEVEPDINNLKFNRVRLTQLGRLVVEEAAAKAAKHLP